MTNATCLRHALSMSAEINKALADLDAAIAKVVNAAKAEGLPQGLIALARCAAGECGTDKSRC
jgi:hypothetical protein